MGIQQGGYDDCVRAYEKACEELETARQRIAELEAELVRAAHAKEPAS